MSLTTGAISRISKGEQVQKPVVQVVSIKAMSSGGTQPQRYRLLVSDSIDMIPAMLAVQCNNYVTDGQITENALIRLEDYMKNVINDATVIIVLTLSVVGMGHPMASGAAPAPAAPPAAAAPAPTLRPAMPPPAPTAPSTSPYGNKTYGQAAGTGGGYPAGGANPYKPVVRAADPGEAAVIPINAINPYSNKWTIKARITTKSEIRKWSNAKGEGTLFSIDLLDSTGGEIRGTFFKDACEKFYPLLEEGKVYLFSGGRVKVVANRQYSSIKNNYEITFDANSEIRPVADDSSIKAQHFSFIPIKKLLETEVNANVDIIGVVQTASEVSEIISQKQGGKVIPKRDLTIVDDSNSEVRVTLWGDKALAQYPWHELPIVAFKGLKVGDYGGRSLAVVNSSAILINPDLPEGFRIHDWRSQFPHGGISNVDSISSGGGSSGNTERADALSKRKSIASIRDEGLGVSDKADYVTVKGYVNLIRYEPNDPWYTACPTPGCNKKVIEGMAGQWTCEKCYKSFDHCIRRYILSMTMQDYSGYQWFSLFNDGAEKLIGQTADTLHEMKVSGDQAGYEQAFKNPLFKPVIARVRVKQELVNDENKLKCSIMKLDDIDFANESHQLLAEIAKY